LKIDPDSIDALINLAGGWKDKGNYRKALSYVQRSVEIQPSGDGYYNVACYFSLLGKYDDALAALGTAISEYGSQWRNLARRDDDFIPMRSHPGFKSLMKGT
jgi:tetratricopeptide (TPR) repeat protein